jgi:hypothetical protein
MAIAKISHGGDPSVKVFFCRACAEHGAEDVVLTGWREVLVHIWRNHRWRWWRWSARNLPSSPFPFNPPTKPSAEFMAFDFDQHNRPKPKPRGPTP